MTREAFSASVAAIAAEIDSIAKQERHLLFTTPSAAEIHEIDSDEGATDNERGIADLMRMERAAAIQKRRNLAGIWARLDRIGAAIASDKAALEARGSDPLAMTLDSLQSQVAQLSQQVQLSLDGGPLRPLLSEVLGDWIEMRQGLAIGGKKIKTDRNRIEDFIEFAGDKPLNKYTYFDFQRWANLLVRVPQNLDKIPAFRGASRQEAADYNDRLPPHRREPTLVEKTIDTNYLSPLRTFLRDMGAEYSFRSPLADIEIRISGAASESVERQPFGVPELNLWFAHAAKEERPDMKWLPLLGSITGARIGELIFLQGKDVYHMETEDGSGHWVLDLRSGITTDDGAARKRQLKNKCSRRLIALHEAFEEVGFVAYAQTRKNDDWLFPAAFYYGKTRVVDPAGAASKRMNRMLQDVGIHKPLESVFHSTRHTAKDIMRLARVDQRTHDLQTGHTFKTVSARYGSKTLVREELDVLRSLPLPQGLDLSPYMERR